MAAANAAEPWSMCAAAGSQAVEGWGGVGVGGRRGVGGQVWHAAENTRRGCGVGQRGGLGGRRWGCAQGAGLKARGGVGGGRGAVGGQCVDAGMRWSWGGGGRERIGA